LLTYVPGRGLLRDTAVMRVAAIYAPLHILAVEDLRDLSLFTPPLTLARHAPGPGSSDIRDRGFSRRRLGRRVGGRGAADCGERGARCRKLHAGRRRQHPAVPGP